MRRGWVGAVSRSCQLKLTVFSSLQQLFWQTDLYRQEALWQLSTTFLPKLTKISLQPTKKLSKKNYSGISSNDKPELPVTAQNLIATTPRTSHIFILNLKFANQATLDDQLFMLLVALLKLISSYLDRITVPVVKSLPSYIKDTNHALEIFCNFNLSGENQLIFQYEHFFFT